MARLLIIEDDPAVAEVIRLSLEAAGHEVVLAGAGAEAMAMLDAGLAVDGALIDVWLRGEDGLDVAEKLAERRDRLPFAVMSGGGPGRSLERVTARADALGARGILFKPFDDDELMALVATML